MNPTPQLQPSKGKKILLWTICIIVVVLVAGVIEFIHFKNPSVVPQSKISSVIQNTAPQGTLVDPLLAKFVVVPTFTIDSSVHSVQTENGTQTDTYSVTYDANQPVSNFYKLYLNLFTKNNYQILGIVSTDPTFGKVFASSGTTSVSVLFKSLTASSTQISLSVSGPKQ